MQLTLVNQAITHFFVGIAFALANLILTYFAPWMPRIISILARRHVRRALIAAYLIALVLQLITSPIFASVLHPVYQELAWSPYEAIFNVLGVLVVDLAYNAWRGVRRGVEVGGQQLTEVKTRVGAELDELGDRVQTVVGDREAAAQQRTAEAATAERRIVDERKQRMDDTLGKY